MTTELDVSDVPVIVADPCQDVACEAVDSCPDGTELAINACCPSCVPVPDAERCEAERVPWDALYQAQLQLATACQADRDCAPVVLQGGWRRYCFVALNTERTADFMNAISLDYHTNCPSCMVHEPANCEGNDEVVCDAGRCSMAR